jgi:hypothetical protein
MNCILRRAVHIQTKVLKRRPITEDNIYPIIIKTPDYVLII